MISLNSLNGTRLETNEPCMDEDDYGTDESEG